MTEAWNGGTWRGRAQDVAVAAGGCVLDLVGFSRILSGPEAFPPWVGLYAAAGFAVLLWRRRAPRAVFAIVWLHSAVASIAIPSYGPVVAVAIGLYTVSDLASRRAGSWALALSFLPTGFLAVGEALSAPPESAVAALAGSFTVLSLVNAGAWSLGRWARAHREQLALAEEQRRRTAQEAVARERARIARDLHDVVSHSVGVMTLQAAGARQVLAAGKLDRAAKALADIEGAGTQAMTELRRMLGVLRVPEPADDELVDGVDTHPRPGLHDLEKLVEGMLAAGVPVRLVVHGPPGELDAGADLSAYRIVQESLTNVVKHAGPGVPTVVELRWGDTGLDLSITSSRPVHPPDPDRSVRSGYGLIGLRERASAVGGRLEAGPQPDGGFRVTATLPVRNACGLAS
jgi:signal transduction histidine kinase